MIIDAYNTTQDVRGRSDYLTGARPGEEPPAHVPFDPQRILSRMDAAGVDMAMVCSLAQRIENDFIIGLQDAHPDRFIGFGQVMPQADDAVEEIRQGRQKAAQAQQSAESLQNVAGAARDLSQTDTGGKNALTDLMSAANAGSPLPEGAPL